MTIDTTGTSEPAGTCLSNPRDDGDGPTPAAAAAIRPVAPVLADVLLATRRRRAVLPRLGPVWHARARRVGGQVADAGMATAEYAIATLAAVGFAGLLVVILKGNEVKGLLMGIIRQALSL